MVLHIDEDSWTSGFLFCFWANFCHLVKKIKIPGQLMQKKLCEKKGGKIAIFWGIFLSKGKSPYLDNTFLQVAKI